jgi:UDP-N-acetylmuramyl pentapeptide phosphotransferase/UDP-N-acetylglucosamine-1-phosphate transferase
MVYIYLFILLLAGELLYIKIAQKFGIYDRPNSRSSHNYIVIRGGGVIFWLSGICLAMTDFPLYGYFIYALSLICFVSFMDDISSLRNRVRILCHFLTVFIILGGACVQQFIPWWACFIALIVGVGVLNAFNFIDGINGMAGLYNLTLLAVMQYINLKYIRFVEPDFIWFAIIPCVVFLIFNFRSRALCFLGDVGSIALAVWEICIVVELMKATNSLVWILLFAICGIDTVGTIVYRLILRKNIFRAHRMFFFQILTNEMKLPHVFVSSMYSVFQLIMNIILFRTYLTTPSLVWPVGLFMLLILTLLWLIRFYPLIQKKVINKTALKS